MRIEVEPGVELEVAVRGDGPTLVCLHGFGGAKEDFADHLDSLAQHRRVVAPDLRGHGESDRPDDPDAYSLDRMVLDVEAVADALGAHRYVLLGHSMGGMVARRAAVRDPGRVSGLVLMSTAAGPPAGLDPELVDAVAQLARDDWSQVGPLLDELRPVPPPRYARLLKERAGFAEFVASKWSRLSPVMWSALGPQLAREPDGLDGLRTLGCPTLVMVGDLDLGFYDASLAMAEVIPGARLVVITESGHHPQFEQPELWRDALEAFLADVAHRSRPGSRRARGRARGRGEGGGAS